MLAEGASSGSKRASLESVGPAEGEDFDVEVASRSTQSSADHTRYLSVLGGAALISAWNTTSTLINFGAIFGVLGMFGGVLFLLLIQGTAFFVSLSMLDVQEWFRRNGLPIHSFGEFGEALGGKTGRRLFLTVQLANQIGFLPYALTLSLSSLQELVGPSFMDCNIYGMLIILLGAYILVQVSRDFKDYPWISYAVWIVTTALGIILVTFAFTHGDWVFGSEVTPVIVFQNYICSLDSMVDCVPPSQQYSFLSVTGALGSILFSFAPIFILFELSSSMKDPLKDGKKALSFAFTYSTVLYGIIGLSFAGAWGNQVPYAVESVLPSGSWQSYFANGVIFFCMILDFVISATVINRETIRKFAPDFEYKWDCRSNLQWAGVTFIPITLVFIITLFVPELESIISFVDAFAIPWAQFIVPVICIILFFRGNKSPSKEVDLEDNNSNDDDKDSIDIEYKDSELVPTRKPFTNFMFGVSILIGTTLSLIKIGVFFYNLTLLDFSGDYFCSEVASI